MIHLGVQESMILIEVGARGRQDGHHWNINIASEREPRFRYQPGKGDESPSPSIVIRAARRLFQTSATAVSARRDPNHVEPEPEMMSGDCVPRLVIRS